MLVGDLYWSVLLLCSFFFFFVITHLYNNLLRPCGNLQHVEKIGQMPICRCGLQADPGASGSGQCSVVLLLPAAPWRDVKRQRNKKNKYQKSNTSWLRRQNSQCTDEYNVNVNSSTSLKTSFLGMLKSVCFFLFFYSYWMNYIKHWYKY